ncbi:hypothetical protein PCANC_03820 [Puccinia coronata f. sp. avenae]|uniref:Uncharacterized protein n=1 Tax=Puccinia coronata f. sp. avenae TaxID=200324 RepID=A0A2N5T7E1_9BASI|nr:hypothetical protein PCANC_03820 [Puccinia coronata f. sp. avenae]
MIVVKVLSSLPCSDERIQSDLARRLTVSFKMCCPDHLFDAADFHVSFMATQGNYQGTRFLKSRVNTGGSTAGPVAMVYVEVVAPPQAEFGVGELRSKVLERVAKEVDDWISSSFRFSSSDQRALNLQHHAHSPLASSVPFDDVIPVIEYRQMEYGTHALDGHLVISPYGVM